MKVCAAGLALNTRRPKRATVHACAQKIAMPFGTLTLPLAPAFRRGRRIS
jgi:hypothetical protein